MKVVVQGVMQNGNRRVGYEWTAPECFCAVAVFVNEIKTWQQHILTYEWLGQTQFKNNRIRSSCNSLEQKKVWCLHWGDIRKLCSSPMCSPASNCQEKKYIRSFNNKKKKKKLIDPSDNLFCLWVFCSAHGKWHRLRVECHCWPELQL